MTEYAAQNVDVNSGMRASQTKRRKLGIKTGNIQQAHHIWHTRRQPGLVVCSSLLLAYY